MVKPKERVKMPEQDPDERIKNFNELPRNARLEYRKMTNECHDFFSLEQRFSSQLKKPGNSVYFSCMLNNNRVNKSLVSIMSTSYYNIQFFAELKKQAQSIIDYLAESQSAKLSKKVH